MTSGHEKKASKSGKSWTKKYNNKTYHWCKWQKSWVIHDLSECHLKTGNESTSETMTDRETQDLRNNNESTE